MTKAYEREQKERIERDIRKDYLRQFLRKKPNNQRSEEPPAKNNNTFHVEK